MPFNTLANTTEGLQEKRARLQQQYEDYVCPISFALMNNPIKTPCGHYFDQLSLCLEMISARHRGAVQCCPKCRGSLDRFLPSDIDVLKLAEITKFKAAFDLAFPDFTGDFSVYENNRVTIGISERFFNFYSKTSDIFKKIISKDTWKPILILAFGVNRVGDTIVSIEEENLQYVQAKKQLLVGAKNLAINTLEYAIKPTLNATLYATKKMTPFILSNAYNAAEYSVQMTAKGIYWSAPIAANLMLSGVETAQKSMYGIYSSAPDSASAKAGVEALVSRARGIIESAIGYNNKPISKRAARRAAVKMATNPN